MSEENEKPEDKTDATQATPAGDGNVFRLKDDACFDDLKELLDGVATALDAEKKDILIDLSEAEYVTTAAVQALVSINRYSLKKDNQIKWKAPSQGLTDAFNHLGFYPDMMKMEFA